MGAQKSNKNMGVVTMEQLNGMDYEEFILKIGNVIEHCQLCAASLWARQPFPNLKGLHSLVCDFVDALPTIGNR